MRSLAKNMIFFGIGSIVLYFMEMEFIILAWIETWGENIGWAIRIGLVVVGGLLLLLNNDDYAED